MPRSSPNLDSDEHERGQSQASQQTGDRPFLQSQHTPSKQPMGVWEESETLGLNIRPPLVYMHHQPVHQASNGFYWYASFHLGIPLKQGDRRPMGVSFLFLSDRRSPLHRTSQNEELPGRAMD
jgi:hypothetical protein